MICLIPSKKLMRLLCVCVSISVRWDDKSGDIYILVVVNSLGCIKPFQNKSPIGSFSFYSVPISVSLVLCPHSLTSFFVIQYLLTEEKSRQKENCANQFFFCFIYLPYTRYMDLFNFFRYILHIYLSM